MKLTRRPVRPVATASLLGLWVMLQSVISPAQTPDVRRSTQDAARGLATKYPGDLGIGQDESVLLAEDFEADALSTIVARWTEVSNQDGQVLALSPDRPDRSRGKQSLQMTATRARNTGGHLYKRLPREVDRLYARFYVKFAADNDDTHHFVTLGGYHPATNWPQGGAGQKPRGDDRLSVGIEPTSLHGRVPAPGAWNFYGYWPDMKVSADGRYWGQGLAPEAPLQIPKDRWQCVEVMVELNSVPEKADGELALWLDGRLALHIAPGTPRGPWTGMGFTVLPRGGEPFEGFRWRTSPELKLNFFWLMQYVTDGRYRKATQHRVWFDHVVVATEYIGPLEP